MLNIPTRTISFDIGTTLGWAEAIDGVLVRSGSIRIKDTKDRWGRAILNLWDFLNQLILEPEYASLYKLEIAYEIVSFHESIHSAHVFGRILGQIEAFTEAGGWAFVSYNVGVIKKQFTGRGNAKKKDICEVCHKMGWQGGRIGTDNDNDEADAIAILSVHLAARNQTLLIDEVTKNAILSTKENIKIKHEHYTDRW